MPKSDVPPANEPENHSQEAEPVTQIRPVVPRPADPEAPLVVGNAACTACDGYGTNVITKAACMRCGGTGLRSSQRFCKTGEHDCGVSFNFYEDDGYCGPCERKLPLE